MDRLNSRRTTQPPLRTENGDKQDQVQAKKKFFKWNVRTHTASSHIHNSREYFQVKEKESLNKAERAHSAAGKKAYEKNAAGYSEKAKSAKPESIIKEEIKLAKELEQREAQAAKQKQTEGVNSEVKDLFSGFWRFGKRKISRLVDTAKLESLKLERHWKPVTEKPVERFVLEAKILKEWVKTNIKSYF